MNIDKGFVNEMKALAEKYGIKIGLYADNSPLLNMSNQERRFDSIIDQANDYSDLIAKVYQDTLTPDSAGSLLGYAYGDTMNKWSMLLHVMSVAKMFNEKPFDVSGFESIKGSVKQYLDSNSQARDKIIEDDAALFGRAAVFCLGSLYQDIKSAIGNKPLLAGELLLILECMSLIALPHIIMGFCENDTSEGEALALPIDYMFKTLNDYHFDKDSHYMVPKTSPELLDNCECLYCAYRRLRAKHGIKTQ